MAFPNAPSPLSYGPPQVSFEGLDQLGNNYFQGAEQRRKYDLARAFQGGISKKADGTPDFGAMAEILAQHGAPEQVIPFSQQSVEQQQREALQGALGPGAAGGAPSPSAPPQAAPSTPSAPVGVPPRTASPSAASPAPRGAMPQPALSSAGTDNAGAQTLRGMATEFAAGQDISPYLPRFAAGFKVGLDDPLTPEQEAAIGPGLGKSIAALRASQPQSQTPAQGGQTGLLLPPGVDPRQAITQLRTKGDQLAAIGSPAALKSAQQFYDRADKLESDAFGDTHRAQGNLDRAFTEQVRQHGVAEMAPVKIGTGSFGEDIMAVKDPASGGFRMIDPKTGQLGPIVQGGASVKESTIPAKDLELDRKAGRNVDYLTSLDPEQQGIVRKMANYEMNPASLSIKGGHRERVLSAVAQFDPNYDQKNYAAFSSGLKSFQDGKKGDAVRAFSVGIEHIDQLVELGHALNNGDIPKINELRNWVKKNIGEDAPTNFEGLKAIVGAEIVKAIVGAGSGTGEERAAAARTVAAASSIKQLEGIAKTYGLAMGAQLGGLQRQYEQSTGRKDFDRLLSPQAIRARDSHNAPTSSSGTPANAAPPMTERKAGQVYPTPKGPMTWTGTGWLPAQQQ